MHFLHRKDLSSHVAEDAVGSGVGEKRNDLKVKSVAVFTAIENVEEKLTEMGFKFISQATIVSDAKFWDRRLYKNQGETVAVSNEIGEALHLRDPVITLCARQKTIDEVKGSL